MDTILAREKCYPVEIWKTLKLPSVEQVIDAFTDQLEDRVVVRWNTVAERIAATGDLTMLGRMMTRARRQLGMVADQLNTRILLSAARHDQRHVLGTYANTLWLAPERLIDYAEAAAEGGRRRLFDDLLGRIPAELQTPAVWNRWMMAAIASETSSFALDVLETSAGRADDLREFLWQAEARNMHGVATVVKQRIRALEA